jgi:hypothetical protein
VSNETAKCGRCGREIAITDSEYSAWEVIGEMPERALTVDEAAAYVSCESCLTPEEVGAIENDAMEWHGRALCLRCGRDPGGSEVTAEELDDWIVTTDGRTICVGCQTHEDRLADYSRTIAGLDQLGAIRRDVSDGTITPRSAF